MEDTSHSDLRALAHGKPEPMPNSRAASPLAIDRDAAVSDHQPPATAGTLGGHLARRLVQAGVSDVFAVPGDSNLVLLDHLAAEPGLSLVRCCNELNAGHAADGYARARGVGACAVAFTVGGLSLLNAVAGANSDDLPVICIVGGPNSNDYGASNRVLHHTIGLPDFSHELRCFQPVTCYQVVVNNLDDAHEQIDTAISTALRESKPVYISVSCNLAGIPHPTFSPEPAPMIIPPRLSCRMNLEHAVHAAAEFLNRAVKPVMVAGPKIRVARAAKAFARLADASGYPVAIMPSAKGLVAEHHPRFIGTYWGVISTAFCAETVESADAYLLAGPVLSDFTTVGYSLALRKERAVVAQPDRVVVGDGPAFGGVLMADFLGALAERLERNTTAHDNHRRIFVPDGELPARGKPDEPLRVNVLFRRIQAMLSGESAVFSDAGDSWFNCQKLKLPPGCAYESQQQYGSAGWSVGAALGYAQAAKDRRVVACIGDGNFQMTAQEVSTMLRCAHRSVVFVVNNGGYTNTTEAAAVQGGAPYNTIKDWDYAGLVDAIDNGGGSCCWTAKVRTEEELEEAIGTAMGERRGCLCFVEVVVHRDDTSKELLQFGARVSAANSRPPMAW